MKSYCRKACWVTLLVLALASPAFAGWIHTDAKQPAPTSPTLEAESTPETTATVTEQALSLLQSLLSLL